MASKSPKQLGLPAKPVSRSVRRGCRNFRRALHFRSQAASGLIPSPAPARRPRPALSGPDCACAAQRGTPLAGLTARGRWLVARCGCPGRPLPSRGAGRARAHGSPLVRSPGAGDGWSSRSFAGPMEEPPGKPLSFEEKEKVRGCGAGRLGTLTPSPGVRAGPSPRRRGAWPVACALRPRAASCSPGGV